jgi:hypothetical protein
VVFLQGCDCVHVACRRVGERWWVCERFFGSRTHIRECTCLQGMLGDGVEVPLRSPSRSYKPGVLGEKRGCWRSLYTEVWEGKRTCEAGGSFSGVRQTSFSHARRAICCVGRVVGGYGRCGEKSGKRGDARGVEEIHQQPGYTRARRSIATHGRTCAEGRKGVGAPTETWDSGRGKRCFRVFLGKEREDTRSLCCFALSRLLLRGEYIMVVYNISTILYMPQTRSWAHQRTLQVVEKMPKKQGKV